VSHDDFNQELNALREKLPALGDENSPGPEAPLAVYYSPEIAKRAHNYALEGLTLSAISRKTGMPALGTLIRWSKENGEFAKMLRSARSARALLLEEKALEIADELEDPKMVGVAKVRSDIYWRGAEVADPATYGKKIEHKGDISTTVKFVKVHTGFGPLPDALKFPELNPDGTIKKDPPKDVKAEIVENGSPNAGDNQTADATGNPPGAPEAGLGDASCSGVGGEPDGLQPLPPEQRY
jgi:hypothetical protein